MKFVLVCQPTEKDSMSSSLTLELPTGLSISKLKSSKTIFIYFAQENIFSIESEKSENLETLPDGGL